MPTVCNSVFNSNYSKNKPINTVQPKDIGKKIKQTQAKKEKCTCLKALIYTVRDALWAHTTICPILQI